MIGHYDGSVSSAVPAANPTGQQFHLRGDGTSAQIAQVGASLRHLVVHGTEVMPPYPEDQPTPMCSGVVLVPWPNRVRDGVWNDGGTTRELAVTERRFSNAIHGLLRYVSYETREQTPESVTLGARVVPQTGYPYLLDTAVSFRLTGDGIVVRHTVTNLGGEPAPVAVGIHPYFTFGGADLRDVILRVPAATTIQTDDRMLPIGEVPVAGTLDLREGQRLGDLHLDTGFTDLRRDADGRVRSTLTALDGRRITQWLGAGFEYVQVFTTGGYPGQDLAVAIEPMTAPADALNSGRGLRHLDPGETWELTWGIELAED